MYEGRAALSDGVAHDAVAFPGLSGCHGVSVSSFWFTKFQVRVMASTSVRAAMAGGSGGKGADSCTMREAAGFSMAWLDGRPISQRYREPSRRIYPVN